jgi:hypothetical protein
LLARIDRGLIDQPDRATDELLIALAGPPSSFALAGVFAVGGQELVMPQGSAGSSPRSPGERSASRARMIA